MFKAILRLSVVLVCAVLLGLACREELPQPEKRSGAVYPAGLKGVPDIRVHITSTLEKAMLSVSGPYRLEVVYLDGKRAAAEQSLAVSVDVSPTPHGVKMGDDELLSAEVIPRGNTWLELDGKRYPGALSFSRAEQTVKGRPASRVRVVARLNLEEYLLGVREMPPQWPAEALAAQAVAARTYALYYIKTRKLKRFDVESTEMSQVWRPDRRANLRLLRAVNATRGVVLTDNFRLFPSFFSSSCGGFSANAQAASFTKVDLIPLSGVRCQYCLSQARPWRQPFTISLKDLSRRLSRAGVAREPVKRIRLLGAARQSLPRQIGRVYFVELTLKSGKKRVIPADTFRHAVGRRALASTYFAVKPGDPLIFEGKGYGHGIGLCQHGAKFLAEQDYSYADILAYYYPGAKLVRLWEK